MQLRYKLWVDENDQVLFGEGRDKLLVSIQEVKSLAGAARALEMGYRAAWGRLKASEDRLGFTLVERGDEGRRALKLTDQAEQLLETWQDMDKDLEKFVAGLEKKYLPKLRKLRN